MLQDSLEYINIIKICAREDDNRRLIGKVAKALNLGGLAVIHDMQRSEPPTPFNALFSLALFMFSRARTYSYQEITGWLKEGGFCDFNRTDLPPTEQTSIVTAVKTG